jgi:hypothetical protein
MNDMTREYVKEEAEILVMTHGDQDKMLNYYRVSKF